MPSVAATFSTELIADVALTTHRVIYVGASFLSGLNAEVDVINPIMVNVSASFSSALQHDVDLQSPNMLAVSAAFSTRLAGVVDLHVPVNKTVSASFSTSLIATVNLSGASDYQGRTLCDLVKESLSLWGFLCAKSAPKYAVERAITDINSGMQTMWTNAEGRDYWSNETITLTLLDGQDSFILPDSVQNVVGPCRRASNKRPLAPVRSIGELESFSALYLEGMASAEPLAYHVERMKQTATDPAKVVLRVTPPVDGDSVDLLLEVVKECPRFTVDDLQSCPLIPIPHQYAETLLIPLIRYNACSYYLFKPKNEAQKEFIEREYKQARITLGLTDPNPIEKDTPR